jgi:hypothetical protein
LEKAGLPASSSICRLQPQMTDCVLLHVEKKEMMLAMSREPKLSALFVKYLLKRNIRYQDDLVDQLFNSSEKRLARVLLLMAHFGKEGVFEALVPRLSQETLVEMVGTTRSRVSFFMNRFRTLGFINYDVGDNLCVHSSLLNVVLHDDDGISVTPRDNDSTALPRKGSEPPPEHGGLPDKERAKRPRLARPRTTRKLSLSRPKLSRPPIKGKKGLDRRSELAIPIRSASRSVS